MMLAPSTSVALPRRLTAYYLLFGIAAITWLTIGVVIAVQELSATQTDSACLTLLGRAVADIQADYARQGESQLQSAAQRLRSQASLLYCAIVSNDGHHLAHSTTELLGQTAIESTGAVEQWGDAKCTRFIDSNSRTVREYSAPLKQGGQAFATLRIGIVERDLWRTVCLAAEYAPTTFLGPLLLVFGGACIVGRLVQPISELESQLARVAATPSIGDVSLSPMKATGPAAVGWNRIVDGFSRGVEMSEVGSRLTEGLETVRHRKTDQILNSLQDGVAVTDMEGRITFANQSLAAILGTNGRPLSGESMKELLAFESQGERAAPLQNEDLSVRPVVLEFGRGGDMSQGVLRVARFPLNSSNGTPSNGHVWSIRDITQQKLADQMRNQFVYSATHELRTPLANIKAYAETLALCDSLDVEKQKEFCNTINAEAHRLSRFIDDLLTISRMEVGSLALERRQTDLERLLQETVRKSRPQMEQKKILFEAELPPKLPELLLDKDKLAVVLVNLIGNAAKYTPDGGRVALQVEAKDEMILIHVIDSGIGISVEELPRIFDKFYRSSDPRVQEQTGSGLGLSLAAEIVRLHGGRLTVASELNKGSKFTISLPTR